MPGGPPRLGITTPRSIGKAVCRNRIKRIMRETYRLNPDRFPAEGAALFLVKSCDDEMLVKTEMLELARAIIDHTGKRPPNGDDE